MKILSKLFLTTAALLLSVSSFAVENEKLIKLNFAYPESGTVIGGQIGLVLEKTDIFKIYGFEAHIKRIQNEKELQKSMNDGLYDVIITTESNYVALTEKNATVTAISTLGIEKDFQLVNVINKSFSTKNPKAVEKLNGAFRDAFYYLNTHKSEVNNWYAQLSKMTPKAVDTASRINKNYNAKTINDINLKIP